VLERDQDEAAPLCHCGNTVLACGGGDFGILGAELQDLRSRFVWFRARSLSMHLEVYGASFSFTHWPLGIPAGASQAVLVCNGKILLEQAVHSEEVLPATAPRGYAWSSDENVIPSFSYLYAVTGAMNDRNHWKVLQVTVRHWALVLLFALLPAVWLFGWWRRAMRDAPHRTQGPQ
jgi:hypothetical protein